MEIPTISACINKISDTIARLPVKLYRRDDGKISEIQGDKRLDLLNGETGDTLNTVDLWKAVVEDYFLGNGAWIYLNFDGIQLKSIHYVDSRNISIMTNTDPIFKAFDVFVNGKKYYDFQFIRLFRKTRNGYGNIPLQHENQRILAVAYNALKVEEKMNKKGGNKPGFLKAKTKLSKEALESAKASCNALYDVDGNGVSILNDGLDFQAISSTAVEMQINENKKANSIELSKIFGFPHTIIDGGASDEDNKQFISAVTAILNQIETALDMAMLLEKEKQQGYYFAFDTKELTRGSIKERFEAYEIAIRNHILQVDEIRREEDYEALGFNWVTMGLGDVLLNPKTMEIFTPNTNQLASLNHENRAEMELRFNHNHDSRGRFASGGGGGAPAPKNSEKVLTFGENSGIIENKKSDEYGHYYEQTNKIDVNDSKAVAHTLKEFEEKYSDSDIEHCVVITTSGDVYEVHGDYNNVHTNLLGDLMQGSINEHNHVTGNSSYSFSKEDLTESCADGSKISIAFDEKYRYSMVFPDKKISKSDAYDAFKSSEAEVENINFDSFYKKGTKAVSDEDYQHEVIKRACEKVGIKYGRHKKEK